MLEIGLTQHTLLSVLVLVVVVGVNQIVSKIVIWNFAKLLHTTYYVY